MDGTELLSAIADEMYISSSMQRFWYFYIPPREIGWIWPRYLHPGWRIVISENDDNSFTYLCQYNTFTFTDVFEMLEELATEFPFILKRLSKPYVEQDDEQTKTSPRTL
jgi:hypothetical protein